MCFYIYAPQQSIAVDFFTEYIQLQIGGSSTIIADFLLRNPNPNDPITSVKIIYPNRLYDFQTDPQVFSSDIRPVRRKNAFKDNSGTFLSDRSGINDIYKSLGYSFEQPRNNSRSRKTTKLELKKNTGNGDVGTCFSGEVATKQKPLFTVDNGLSIEQSQFLLEEPFSILSHDLSRIPIRRTPRWIRLSFKSKLAASNLNSIDNKWFNLAINELIYSYFIIGPNDVKEDLKETVNLYKTIVREEGSRHTEEACNAMCDNILLFENDGLFEPERPLVPWPKISSTTYSVFFLCIDYGKMVPTNGFQPDGNIELISQNTLKAVRQDKPNSKSWQTFHKPIPQFFKLSFSLKPNFIFQKLVPYIALFLSLIVFFKVILLPFAYYLLTKLLQLIEKIRIQS